MQYKKMISICSKEKKSYSDESATKPKLEEVIEELPVNEHEGNEISDWIITDG